MYFIGLLWKGIAMDVILIKTEGGFTLSEARNVAQKADTQCNWRFWLPAQILSCEEEGKYYVKVKRRKR